MSASNPAAALAGRRGNKIKLTKQDRVFLAINDLLILVVFLVVLYPVVYIISSSFSSPQAVSTGKVVLWPVDFSLRGYAEVFKYPNILNSYGNTIFYTVAGTLINLVMTIMAAYPLSRRGMGGKKTITFLFTLTMLFSGGMIPNYILNANLHLLNTRWVLLIPNAINIFNLIIVRTFFENNVPQELNEAAQIDGCDHFRFLWSIVLPLSKPIIAVVALYYAVERWNTYFDAFIYLNDAQLYPLQIVLREILVLNQTDSMMVDPTLAAVKQGMADLLKYSLIVVSSAPFMFIYPFVSKHFVQGTLTGAVKG